MYCKFSYRSPFETLCKLIASLLLSISPVLLQSRLLLFNKFSSLVTRRAVLNGLRSTPAKISPIRKDLMQITRTNVTRDRCVCAYVCVLFYEFINYAHMHHTLSCNEMPRRAKPRGILGYHNTRR